MSAGETALLVLGALAVILVLRVLVRSVLLALRLLLLLVAGVVLVTYLVGR